MGRAPVGLDTRVPQVFCFFLVAPAGSLYVESEDSEFGEEQQGSKVLTDPPPRPQQKDYDTKPVFGAELKLISQSKIQTKHDLNNIYFFFCTDV